jgi:hypothetical protein
MRLDWNAYVEELYEDTKRPYTMTGVRVRLVLGHVTVFTARWDEENIDYGYAPGDTFQEAMIERAIVAFSRRIGEPQ